MDNQDELPTGKIHYQRKDGEKFLQFVCGTNEGTQDVEIVHWYRNGTSQEDINKGAKIAERLFMKSFSQLALKAANEKA